MKAALVRDRDDVPDMDIDVGAGKLVVDFRDCGELRIEKPKFADGSPAGSDKAITIMTSEGKELTIILTELQIVDFQ